MAKLNEKTMRPAEVKVAKAICDAQGEFDWKYLRDVEGNPSTAYAYYDYLRVGKKVLKVIEKMYVGGWIAENIKKDSGRANMTSEESIADYASLWGDDRPNKELNARRKKK